jgi:DNA modification methylase
MKYQILQGDNRTTLKSLPDNSIDAIVTDPPYGIDFLGKAWDANTGALETYAECLRVLKPGGHILAFSAARTYHHLAVTLEQAGFEIRDQIMWIYSSGFPKSQDIGKSIDRQSGKASHKAELAEVKDILKQLYADSGKSTAEISRECGFNAGGYLKTDFKDKGWANNLPKDDKWITLKSVLGCGDEYDDYFVTTPQIKVGEKETGCFDQDFDNYTIGARSKTVDITQSQTEAGKAWSGWGTQLKPAHEPIALARKPIKLSIARNCQVHGTGALNIDATRVPFADENDQPSGGENGWSRVGFSEQPVEKYKEQKKKKSDVEIYLNNKKGPMERSTAVDGEGIGMFEGKVGYKTIKREVDPAVDLPSGRFPSNVLGEIGEPYQKYFYCPKVSRRERHIGHETPPAMFGDSKGAYDENGERYAVGLDARAVIDRKDMVAAMGGKWVNDAGEHLDAWTSDANAKSVWLPGKGDIRVHGLTHEYAEWCKANGKDPGNVGNNHPTVKPIELMKYLIRLITPPGGVVLDPFNGSGSTGCAAVELGHEYIGCELDPAYVEIAKKRIEAWYEAANPTTFNRLFEPGLAQVAK